MFFKTTQNIYDLKVHTRLKFLLLCFTGITLSQLTYAESLSYVQAEQYFIEHSYSTQANIALDQATKLQAEAVKNMGLPRVDLNVRAYKFHTETDIPLNGVKNNLEQSLSQGVNDHIDQWQQQNNIPPAITDPLKQGLTQGIQNGVGLIPDKANVILEDEIIRPTISIMMPLYTGGVTTATKNIAHLNAERSELSSKQQQDIQRFENDSILFQCPITTTTFRFKPIQLNIYAKAL